MTIGRPIDLSRAAGVSMPAVGIGTWKMGEDRGTWEAEVAALRHAHELGFRHFDTAEMYGDGAAERLLGEALAGSLDRDDLFVTSKFYPWHATPDAMMEACLASLERLCMDYLDLYLLHWPGSTPMEETIEGARALLDAGMIRAFGISNFDTDAVEKLDADGLTEIVAANQVMFNPARRGVEYDLLPRLSDLRIAAIAYTPIEPSALSRIEGLDDLAEKAGLTVPQLALAWHMTRGLAVPIPKSSTKAHLADLAAAVEVTLDDDLLARIDAVAPPPDRKQPLDII